MRKFPKSIISKISIFCGFVLIISAPFLWNFLNFEKKSEKDQKNEEEYFSQLIGPLSQELLKRWRLGDVERTYQNKGFSCPKLIQNGLALSGEFFKCNFLYLECFFEGKTGGNPFFKIEREKKTYYFTPQKNPAGKFITLTQRGDISLTLQLKETDYKVKLELKDSCRSTFLPEKVYSAGEISEKGQIFDNYGQDIYLDKNYVTYKDKYQLEMAKGANWEIIDPKLVASPYTEISFEKRKEFCIERGGKLLKSRLLDAASFFPTSNQNPNAYFYKYPYPWQKGKSGSFLNEAKTSSRFALKNEDCDKAYVKGCEALGPYVSDNTHSISWIGLKAPLGAYPESVENDFVAKDNLKVSSFYQAPYSLWHEVGLRGHWKGEGFEREDFDFSHLLENAFESDPPPYKVAFRCFYERGEK